MLEPTPIAVEVVETRLHPVKVAIETLPTGGRHIQMTLSSDGDATFVLRLSPALARRVIAELAAALPPASEA